ncbi:MAG: hypothetical protein FJZ01_08615 [Candidatus Sericytochromatia bacterium]|nr:hypothetical protein [Candidatus Tanganyikabacteria bacterium]
MNVSAITAKPTVSRPVATQARRKQAVRTLAPTAVDKFESLIGVTWYNRLTKLPTKYMFGKDHPEIVANPRITVDSAEFAEIKKQLKPGDVILCGNDDSFVHAIYYMGNGEIVHSLAQEKPGRARNWADSLFDGGAWLADRAPLPQSWREAVAMRFRALPRSASDGLGVIHETLDSYFKRVARDNVVILRNPKLTDAGLSAMKTFALAQVGKPYDYGFATFDDARMYCTEMVAKTLMQGPNAPRFRGILSGAGPIKREMYLNEGFLASPDLKPIWKSQSYEKTPFGKANPIAIKP